jgi:death-on-curing protein
VNEPRWVDLQVVLTVHDMQIAEHGGLPGIRDRGLLEPALARPRQLQAYRPDFALWQMASAYACGISSNHPFTDGNRRTALMAAYIFLHDNGWELNAPEIETVLVFEQVANNEFSEEELADWFYKWCDEIPLEG